MTDPVQTDTLDVERLRELLAKATPGPWELQDGCSWRRIGTHYTSPVRSGDGNVLCPVIHHRDRHPDLTAGRGEDVYANLNLIVAAVNALPRLIAEAEAKRQAERERDEAVLFARHYATHYLLDQRADRDCCVSDDQHRDVIALFDALGLDADGRPVKGDGDHA